MWDGPVGGTVTRMNDHDAGVRQDPVRVLIAGGGVAALEALIALRELAPDRVAPVVVSATEDFVYRPLLVGEPFGLGTPRRHRLAELCAALGAGFVPDRITGVMPDRHAVRTADGVVLDYDILLVAVGARPTPAFEFGATFEREQAPEDFDVVLEDVDEGFVPRVAIIVPDGVSWPLPAYELAMLTASWAGARHPARTSVTVVTYEPAPLAMFGTTVSDAVGELLAAEGIALRCGVHPDVVSSTALRVGGTWMDADRIVSLPVLTGPRIPGLPADAHGFLPVDPFGRVQGVDDVYAAGDGVGLAIKQGGLAAQQAAAAAGHIAARASGRVQAAPPHSVLRGLLVSRDGPCYLRAELDDVEATSTFSREALWWPPSKIASRWLAPYLAGVEAESESEADADVAG